MIRRIQRILAIVLALILSPSVSQAVVLYKADFELVTTGHLIEDELIDGGLWDTAREGTNTYPMPFVRAPGGTIPSGTKIVNWTTKCTAYNASGRCTSGNWPDAGVDINLPATRTIATGDKIYFGCMAKFSRINSRNIWDMSGTFPNSFDKLCEIVGPSFFGGSSIRWIINAGAPGGGYSTIPANKFTFAIGCAESAFAACTALDGDDKRKQNQNGYSTTNPYLADYDRWYALMGELTIGTTAATGRVRFWVNETLIIDYNIATTNGTVIDRYLINGTIAQPVNDAPDHNRYLDLLMVATTLADMTAVGFMADPQGAGPDITPPAVPAGVTIVRAK